MRRSALRRFSWRDDRLDLGGGPLDLAVLVDHDLVVVAWRASSIAALPLADSSSSALSVARERRRWNRASRLGGTMKTRSASGTRSLTTRAPWTSILRITSWPAASARDDLAPGRAVPVAVDLGALEQLARVAQLPELRSDEELVGGSRHLARAGSRVVQVTT